MQHTVYDSYYVIRRCKPWKEETPSSPMKCQNDSVMTLIILSTSSFDYCVNTDYSVRATEYSVNVSVKIFCKLGWFEVFSVFPGSPGCVTVLVRSAWVVVYVLGSRFGFLGVDMGVHFCADP